MRKTYDEEFCKPGKIFMRIKVVKLFCSILALKNATVTVKIWDW